jgi:hypothetical protein
MAAKKRGHGGERLKNKNRKNEKKYPGWLLALIPAP